MSKVMLVMDKPENCLKCEFSDRRLDGTLRCTRNKDTSNTVFRVGIAAGCPLKDVPKRKTPKRYRNPLKSWINGWNACIDEILKERD